MTWFIDLRALSKGGSCAAEVTLRKSAKAPATLDELLAEIEGRQVLLGTHGFNIDRQEGIESLTAWENLLSLDEQAVFIGVLWPGDSRWLPVLDYPIEGEEAMESARLLAPFLDQHFNRAAGLSFVSHSLGARMVLETISNLEREQIERLILMAGAIDDNCLNHEYKAAARKVREISLLVSPCDRVLQLAFPLGNPLAGIISRGHPYWHSALGYSGPDTPYVSNLRPGWLIPKTWNYGHGDYLCDEPYAPAPKQSLPVHVPIKNSPIPTNNPAWSAGFVSTRFDF